MQCRYCFTQSNAPDSKFCLKCGARLMPLNESDNKYPPVPPREAVPVSAAPAPPAPTPASKVTSSDPKIKSPLSRVGLLLTALLSSFALFYSINQIFGSVYGLPIISDFINVLQLVSSDLSSDLEMLLELLLFADSSYETIIKVFQVLGELPHIVSTLCMWLFLISLGNGTNINRRLFCGTASVLKFFRVLAMLTAVIPWCLFLIGIIFIGSEFPFSSSQEIFGICAIICVLVLTVLIAYHADILRLMNTLREGAQTGCFMGTSRFLIFCLFVIGILNMLSALLGGVFDMEDIISLIRTAILPLLHGICLHIYNSKRYCVS